MACIGDSQMEEMEAEFETYLEALDKRAPPKLSSSSEGEEEEEEVSSMEWRGEEEEEAEKTEGKKFSSKREGVLKSPTKTPKIGAVDPEVLGGDRDPILVSEGRGELEDSGQSEPLPCSLEERGVLCKSMNLNPPAQEGEGNRLGDQNPPVLEEGDERSQVRGETPQHPQHMEGVQREEEGVHLPVGSQATEVDAQVTGQGQNKRINRRRRPLQGGWLRALTELKSPPYEEKTPLVRLWAQLVMGLHYSGTSAKKPKDVQKLSQEKVLENMTKVAERIYEIYLGRGPSEEKAIELRAWGLQLAGKAMSFRKFKDRQPDWPQWLSEEGLDSMFKEIQNHWEMRLKREEGEDFDTKGGTVRRVQPPVGRREPGVGGDELVQVEDFIDWLKSARDGLWTRDSLRRRYAAQSAGGRRGRNDSGGTGSGGGDRASGEREEDSTGRRQRQRQQRERRRPEDVGQGAASQGAPPADGESGDEGMQSQSWSRGRREEEEGSEKGSWGSLQDLTEAGQRQQEEEQEAQGGGGSGIRTQRAASVGSVLFNPYRKECDIQEDYRESTPRRITTRGERATGERRETGRDTEMDLEMDIPNEMDMSNDNLKRGEVERGGKEMEKGTTNTVSNQKGGGSKQGEEEEEGSERPGPSGLVGNRQNTVPQRTQTYASATRGQGPRRRTEGQWRGDRAEEEDIWEDEKVLRDFYERMPGERDPRQRFVVRLRYQGQDIDKITREYIRDEIMEGQLKFPGEEVLAILQSSSGREIDVCLKSEVGYYAFWEICKEERRKVQGPLREFQLIPLFKGETKVVTIVFRTTIIPEEDLNMWLERRCRVLQRPERKKDEKNYWWGEYKAIVSLHTDPTTGVMRHLPKYFFMGAERGMTRYGGQPPACFQCGGTGHIRATCRSELCSKCSTRGHRTENCPYPIKCSLCEEQGHVYKYCPESVLNIMFPETYRSEILKAKEMRERMNRERQQQTPGKGNKEEQANARRETKTQEQRRKEKDSSDREHISEEEREEQEWTVQRGKKKRRENKQNAEKRQTQLAQTSNRYHVLEEEEEQGENEDEDKEKEDGDEEQLRQRPLEQRPQRKRTQKRGGDYSSLREQLEEIGGEETPENIPKQKGEEKRGKAQRKKPRFESPKKNREEEERRQEEENEELRKKEETVGRKLARVRLHRGVWEEKTEEKPTLANLKELRDIRTEERELEEQLELLQAERRWREQNRRNKEKQRAEKSKDTEEEMEKEPEKPAEETTVEPESIDLISPTRETQNSDPSAIPDTQESRATPLQETSKGVGSKDSETTCPETPPQDTEEEEGMEIGRV